MLIHSASQLLTLQGGPRRGAGMGDPGIILDGAVLVRDGFVAAVGTSEDLLRQYPDEGRVDARGRVVMPGFVDAHTHLVWAGDRAAEFELRLKGKTYLEIQSAGGGIRATVGATRSATFEQLMEESRQRARRMLAYGTTTAEAKTGYGLYQASELRQLEVLLALDAEGPLEIVPTYLPAHSIPPEYDHDPDGYALLIVQTYLPDLAAWWQFRYPGKPLPFVDVFCEQGAFSLEQTRLILESARRLDFPLKAHVDEFASLGGTALAVSLGAISVDHLLAVTPEDIALLAGSQTAAVGMPCTPFGLAQAQYMPARTMIDAGCMVALGTDLNPGTGWCESMQFVIALACRYMHMTPAEAVCAATINAAAAVGHAGILGSLEPGKQADILILDVPDYRHLAYRFGTNLVKSVYKKGLLFAGEGTGSG